MRVLLMHSLHHVEGLRGEEDILSTFPEGYPTFHPGPPMQLLSASARSPIQRILSIHLLYLLDTKQVFHMSLRILLKLSLILIPIVYHIMEFDRYGLYIKWSRRLVLCVTYSVVSALLPKAYFVFFVSGAWLVGGNGSGLREALEGPVLGVREGTLIGREHMCIGYIDHPPAFSRVTSALHNPPPCL